MKLFIKKCKSSFSALSLGRKFTLVLAMIGVAFAFGHGLVRAGLITIDFSDSESDQLVSDIWQLSTSTPDYPNQLAVKDRSCDNSKWFCDKAKVCSNNLGDGHDGILVARHDVGYYIPGDTEGTQYKWQDDDYESCVPDVCSGSNLRADNTVIYATSTVDVRSYKAREMCRQMGGRLPTLNELACIYENKGYFNEDQVFYSTDYWSSTDGSDNYRSWSVDFGDGGENDVWAQNNYHVRCVKGW